MSDKSIKPPTTSDNSLAPAINYISETRVKFVGGCLRKDKITFTHGKTVNIYIVYEKKLLNYVYSSDLTLGNSLFDAVKLVKTTDIDKYKYSGYGIGFDMERTFGLPAIGFVRNIINFGADMDSSLHINNKKRYFILCIGLRQGLDITTLAAEKMYSVNLTEHNKKFCLSLHYNVANSYLFVNGTKTIKCKAKDSAIVATPLETIKQFLEIIWKRLDFIDMFMILVLIMMLLQLMIY